MSFHSSELFSWQRGAWKGAELFLSFENLGFPSGTEPPTFDSTSRDCFVELWHQEGAPDKATPPGTRGTAVRASGLSCRGSGEADGAHQLFLGTAASPGCRGAMGAGICLDVHPKCAVPRSRPQGGISRAGSSAGSGVLSAQNSSRGRNFAAIPQSSSGRSGTRSKGSDRTSILLPAAAAPGPPGRCGTRGRCRIHLPAPGRGRVLRRSVEFQAPWKTGSRQDPPGHSQPQLPPSPCS